MMMMTLVMMGAMMLVMRMMIRMVAMIMMLMMTRATHTSSPPQVYTSLHVYTHTYLLCIQYLFNGAGNSCEGWMVDGCMVEGGEAGWGAEGRWRWWWAVDARVKQKTVMRAIAIA